MEQQLNSIGIVKKKKKTYLIYFSFVKLKQKCLFVIEIDSNPKHYNNAIIDSQNENSTMNATYGVFVITTIERTPVIRPGADPDRVYNFTIKRLEQGVFLDWKSFKECEDLQWAVYVHL